MTLDLSYGNAVTGAQRFPRPELEARLLRRLTTGAGIKMFGQRRIGKSTFRLYATEHFDKTQRPYIYVDGQGMRSLSDLLSGLMKEMPGERNLMRQALTFVSSGPVTTALEAMSKGTEFQETVLSAHWQIVSDAIRKWLRGSSPKPALIIDEFSYVIDNMIKRDEPRGRGRDDADKLLASMREWRGEGMTMLLTGSIGFAWLIRKYGLNQEHLNDLHPFLVPELTEGEARAFVQSATQTPSNGAWTAEHTEEFLRQTGVFYPSFLVRGLLEIGLQGPADPADFARVFAETIRPDFHADFYNQFDRRFKAYGTLPNDEHGKLILPALKSIMEAAGSCASDAIPCGQPFTRVELQLALTMLTEDGFIHFTEDHEGERRWKPASRLASLWWKRARLT